MQTLDETHLWCGTCLKKQLKYLNGREHSPVQSAWVMVLTRENRFDRSNMLGWLHETDQKNQLM